MKKVSTAIIAAVLTTGMGFSVSVLADADHKHHDGKHKYGKAEHSEKMIKKELNLTDEQVKQLKAKKEQYRDEREKLEKKHRDDAENILTDEQREKVKKMKDEKKEKMLERLEKRKQEIKKD